MAETMDIKEDGEIEDSGEEILYKTIDRPSQPTQQFDNIVQNHQDDQYESESSCATDSDGETPSKKLKTKRLQKLPPIAFPANKSKNGALWRNILQEETLTENLKSCDVSSRKRKHERGAETYDFVSHRVGDLKSFHKRRKTEFSGNDSSSDASTKSRKFKKARYRRNKQKKNQKRESSPRILPDLAVTLDSCDDDFAKDLADKLSEEKCDLILKTVQVIGKEASLELFQQTQQIEKTGGMLTIYQHRRRTPGGIFLFLLKSSETIDGKQKQEIFDADKIADKKWASEQSDNKEEINNPPPSPVNSEVHAEVNDNNPDIGLVSQKILDFSNPSNDREINQNDDPLDYTSYDDMDTF